MDLKVFEIQGTLNGIYAPQIFVAENYEQARIYFREWIRNKEFKDWRLFKIGYYNKANEFIKSMQKVFISNWYNEFETKEERKAEQLRLDKASKETETKEILKTLFDGREINDK